MSHNLKIVLVKLNDLILDVRTPKQILEELKTARTHLEKAYLACNSDTSLESKAPPCCNWRGEGACKICGFLGIPGDR